MLRQLVLGAQKHAGVQGDDKAALELVVQGQARLEAERRVPAELLALAGGEGDLGHKG